MSVYKRGDRWHFDFWLLGARHTSPAGFETKAEAQEAEDAKRRIVRRRAAGLETLEAAQTPRFTDWAGITLKWLKDRKQIKRPDEARNTLRMILAFWGARPTKQKPVKDGLYKDLRLGDPIERPELMEDFEDWMTARGLSGARKNHYRSACSMMYRVALLPTNRRRSGVTQNPFAGVLRDRVTRRMVTLTEAQLNTWIQSAPLPVAIAVAIGALAPALRFGNVVALRRSQLSPDKAFLTTAHKTDRDTGLPLTIALPPSLRDLITQIETQWPDDAYVIPLAGERYWQMQRLVKQSILAAKLPYGRTRKDGVTFHVLRHTLHTFLARWRVDMSERKIVTAHRTMQMVEWYEHLVGADTAAPMALISERLPVAAGVAARVAAVTDPALPDLRKHARSRAPRRRRSLVLT